MYPFGDHTIPWPFSNALSPAIVGYATWRTWQDVSLACHIRCRRSRQQTHSSNSKYRVIIAINSKGYLMSIAISAVVYPPPSYLLEVGPARLTHPIYATQDESQEHLQR
jgi:hypothetical protein